MKYLRVLFAVCLCLFLFGFGQRGGEGKPAYRILVKFYAEVSKHDIAATLAQEGFVETKEIPHIGVLLLPVTVDAETKVLHLQHSKQVAFAEVDYPVPPSQSIPNDPLYVNEWHLPKIECPAAWDTSTGSSSVIIAILDTGCDPTHPDLVTKYVAGWNTYDNNSDTHDVYGHGTAVAGTAAASSNNGIGVASPAWGCLLMPMRISDTGGYGYGSTISAALTWAADHGARVANISYAMTWSSAVTAAAQYFQSKGGVVCMSAGNSGTFDTTPENPAILTIGATDSADVLASWSTTGNDVDLSAPGVSIRTTGNGGTYQSWSGTSFSSPLTAGVAALVLSVRPELSAMQVQEILKQSADDLGDVGYDTSYGWGRINANRAVLLAQTYDIDPPIVSFLSPADGATVMGTISVQVEASDNVSVSSVSLYRDTVLIGTLNSAPFTFNWDTTTASEGVHILKAVATDPNGNNAETSISVSVRNGDYTNPICTITSPVNGSHVSKGFTVNVSASDNVGVTMVQLFVDGQFKSQLSSTPYTFSLNAQRWTTGSHTIMAKAFDAAGNSAVSTITVYK